MSNKKNKNIFRKLYEKHPKFRKNFIKLDNVVNRISLFYWIFCITIIIIIATAYLFSLYWVLPENIKNDVITPFFAVLLTTIVTPYLFKLEERRQLNKKQLYENCKDIYIDLIENVSPQLLCSDKNEKRVLEYEQFLTKHYTKIKLFLPVKNFDNLTEIYYETQLKNTSTDILDLLLTRATNDFRKLSSSGKIYGTNIDIINIVYKNNFEKNNEASAD